MSYPYKGGKVMLSKDKIINIGYRMMEEIEETNSPRQKEEIFSQLKIIAYILNEDIPNDMHIFVTAFRDLL